MNEALYLLFHILPKILYLTSQMPTVFCLLKR